MMNIVKATKAHYAALQHRPEPDRLGLDFEVTGLDGKQLNAGTIWVKASTDALRKANMTRLLNRLRDMYPEGRSIHIEFRDKERGGNA